MYPTIHHIEAARLDRHLVEDGGIAVLGVGDGDERGQRSPQFQQRVLRFTAASVPVQLAHGQSAMLRSINEESKA